MNCEWCGSDMSGAHPNRRYCSLRCQNKARYARTGVRSTPEQRGAWYRARIKRPGYREKLRRQDRARYERVQEYLRSYKMSSGCADCGYNEHHAALEFDHIDGTKELNVCNAKSIKQAQREISKCEVVCANCHAIRTFNRLQSPCKPDIFEATYEAVD